MTMWEKRAHEVENVYGGYVDWEERFYECPECGEPIYEDDWDSTELMMRLFLYVNLREMKYDN